MRHPSNIAYDRVRLQETAFHTDHHQIHLKTQEKWQDEKYEKMEITITQRK